MDINLTTLNEILDENINTIKTRLYKALEDLKIEINIDSQLGGMS